MPSFSVIKKTETEAAQISLCSDGIVRVMIKKKTEVNAARFQSMFKAYNEMVLGEKYAFIYYAEDSSSSVSEDGREFAKKEENSFPKICNAVVVPRLAHKLVANFYFRYNKPSYPFKAFNKMEDAEKWCYEQAVLAKQTLIG